jgi:uncharacterized protein YcbX
MAIVGTVAEIWRYPVKSMGGEQLARCTVGPLGIPGDRGWALRDEAIGEIRGGKKFPFLMECSARYLEEPKGAATPPVVMKLPDGSEVRSDAADLAARLSAAAGKSVSLWPLQSAENSEHYRRKPPDNPDFEGELRQIFGRLPDEPLPDLSVFPPEIFEFVSPLGTYFDAFPLHLLTTASLDELRRHNGGADFDRRRFRPNFLIRSDGEGSGFPEHGWGGRQLRIGGVSIKLEMPTVRCVMTTQAQPGLPKDPSVLRTIVRDAGQNLGVYASVAAPGAVEVGDPVEVV